MCVIHRSHRNKQMDERLLYYYRRTKARNDPNCLCFIFDKWNSYTTTVPFFTRSPLTNFASNYRHFILRLHVLLVLVHGKPDSNYFFVLNDSVSADANFNIEGIRRSLLLHQDGKPLPPLIYSYSDSGEKCIVLLIYFGTLVEREVCHVALSILYSPQTHCCCDGRKRKTSFTTSWSSTIRMKMWISVSQWEHDTSTKSVAFYLPFLHSWKLYELPMLSYRQHLLWSQLFWTGRASLAMGPRTHGTIRQ
jgi:hypothetical protein